MLNRVQNMDRLMSRLQDGDAASERAPNGTKSTVDKALNALVANHTTPKLGHGLRELAHHHRVMCTRFNEDCLDATELNRRYSRT